MSVRTVRGALLGALVVVAAALFAPAAEASITPAISLDQSGGTQAGATQNLGLDIKFNTANTYPVSDTPENLTINLPPGLLANAAMNGGACLTTTDLSDTNCQVGTGSVTAYALAGTVPLPTDVTFDLVPPPAPGDLAGLAVNFNGNQIGSTGGIRVRPSGDPDGVGITIDMVLPNQLDATSLGLPLGTAGVPIAITEINSTFDGLRYPTTCPSTPANVSISTDSYGDPTVHNLSAPLQVTGCSSLAYAPKVAVQAVKDKSDRQVALTATVTQAATESPNRTLGVTFPGAALGVNLAAVKLLCANAASGNCSPVGTVTATSPLYPKTLTAQAYLTGTALGPTLTLVFPPPFPLTLVGTVTLTTKAADFSGLPDIPLTNMTMKFNGGAEGMFLTNCDPGSGTASASASDQNGDKTANAAIKYQIQGCPASASSSGTGSGSATTTNAAPAVTSPAVQGFNTGHPSISFRVTSRRHAAKLTQLTVKLPSGLSFIKHRVGKHMKVTGVKITSAKTRSLSISHGRLVIRLRKPASAVGVKLTSVLKESSAMAARAHKGKVGPLRLTIVALNTKHRSHTITKMIRLT